MKITYKYSNEINEGQVIYRKNENSFDFISNKRGGCFYTYWLFTIKYRFTN